jgi:hypothetical protein
MVGAQLYAGRLMNVVKVGFAEVAPIAAPAFGTGFQLGERSYAEGVANDANVVPAYPVAVQ